MPLQRLVADSVVWLHVGLCALHCNAWVQMRTPPSENNIAGNDKLQLMAAAWGKNKKDMMKNKKVTVNDNDFFPCLNMEMFWMENDDLNFRIHLKPNQQLKHLNSGSTTTQQYSNRWQWEHSRGWQSWHQWTKKQKWRELMNSAQAMQKLLKLHDLNQKPAQHCAQYKMKKTMRRKRKREMKKERDTRTKEQCFFALHAQKTGRSQYPR